VNLLYYCNENHYHLQHSPITFLQGTLMPRRLPLSIVLPALLFSGLSATLCAAELPVYSGTLAAKSSREHQLTLQPGDYVQGRLSGNGMRLVLLDKNGQRVRVLSQGKRDTEEFMFVAGAAGPYRLDVRAPQAGDYRLELLQQVPRTAQTVPAQLPDSPRLRALLQQPAGLEAFWAEVRHSSTPLVESTGVTPPLAEHETLVTFLWRGAERGVRLFGGPSADHEELQHLPGTDVWYRSYRLPDSTRLAYRLAPDVPELNAAPHIRRRAILATAQRDPLNPHSSIAAPLDQYDGESLLELPAAPAAIWNAPRPAWPPAVWKACACLARYWATAAKSSCIDRPAGKRTTRSVPCW
jgi:enterochelin esterase family protein